MEKSEKEKCARAWLVEEVELSTMGTQIFQLGMTSYACINKNIRAR